MTFSQYIQNLGFLLAQWLPICGLMYLAVRLGLQHGIKALVIQPRFRKSDQLLSDGQRATLPTEQQ